MTRSYSHWLSLLKALEWIPSVLTFTSVAVTGLVAEGLVRGTFPSFLGTIYDTSYLYVCPVRRTKSITLGGQRRSWKLRVDDLRASRPRTCSPASSALRFLSTHAQHSVATLSQDFTFHLSWMSNALFIDWSWVGCCDATKCGTILSGSSDRADPRPLAQPACSSSAP